MKTGTWIILIVAICTTACLPDFNISSLDLIQSGTDNQTMSSLFADDTCKPPCWFGLTVNNSDSESVLAFIESSTQYFQDWKAPSDVENGVFTFYWIHYDRPERIMPNNQIGVDDESITYIEVFPNVTISLGEVF